MSNEEITEEIYYYAHANGFVDELNQRVNKLRHTEPNKTLHDRVYNAYTRIIEKKNLTGIIVK